MVTCCRKLAEGGLVSGCARGQGGDSVRKWRSRGRWRPARSSLGDRRRTEHVPVLLGEVLDCFEDVDMRVFVDATVGAAGHACALIEAHPEVQTLVGIDRDPRALEIAQEKLALLLDPLRCHLFHGNFSTVEEILDQHPNIEDLELSGVDAMLMDIGVSSMQVDNPDRGFSFAQDGPLDMRMDPGAALSAKEVVNTWSEMDLGKVLRHYGEEKQWRQVSQRICRARAKSPIQTTQQLVEAIGNTYTWGGQKSRRSKKSDRIHPATRTFQALRIVVNKELASLEEALPVAIECLKPGGRLGVISFHSLEDRIVKRAFMRASGKVPLSEFVYGEVEAPMPYNATQEQQPGEQKKIAKVLNSRPIVPSPEEIENNPRSRSAKLRCLEKL